MHNNESPPQVLSNDPIVFVSTPSVRGHVIIESGNPEKLVSSNAVFTHTYECHGYDYIRYATLVCIY